MFWERLALLFVVIFAIIGVAFTSVVIHEYVHYNDFKKFNITDERLCGFVLPTGNQLKNWSAFVWSPIGYYKFKVETENMTPSQLADYERAESNTETNAYTIGALIFVFYMFCYLIITFARYKDKMRLITYHAALADREEYISELERYINFEKQ